MRKTDKKLENEMIRALNSACDELLLKFKSFKYLTHLMDFSNPAKSLKIICFFNGALVENDFGFDIFTNKNKEALNASKEYISIKSLLEKQMKPIFKEFKADNSNIEFKNKN